MSLLRRTPTVPDGTLACPRDGAPLQKVVVDRVTLDRCGSCHGIWFDPGELRRVAGERQVEADATRARRVPVLSPFPCPRCKAACHVTHVQDVAVDACSACRGVWLDAGELEEAKRQVKVRRILDATPTDFRDFLRRV